MAALGFHVHTDKENETSLHGNIDKNLKGRSLQSFQKGCKLTQPTPRKALGSVNHELPSSAHVVRGKGVVYSQPPSGAFSKSKKLVTDENLQAGYSTKKAKSKRSPVVHTGIKKTSAYKHNVKARSPKAKPKATLEPIPKIPDDVEYDSDTIFPRKDRLSSYVDKLLTWRPPCLFGIIPDSESEASDGEIDMLGGIELDDIPVCLFEDGDIPQDLSHLLVDLPPLSPPNEESQPAAKTISSCDHLNDQSLDTSLHLGSLKFGAFDLDPADDIGLESQHSASD